LLPNSQCTRRVLIHEFDMEVDNRNIQKSDFYNLHYDRYNGHYEKIHFICKLIFEQLGVSDMYKHDTSLIFPIFIDMNKLFEKYVIRLFEEFRNEEFTIQKQPDTATDAWETNAIVDLKDKQIIPDLIIESKKQDEKFPILADVKYMTSKKFGSSQLYQIAFYLNEYKKKDAYALIPESQESNEFSWKAKNQNITINLVKVPIDDFLQKIYFDPSSMKTYIKEIMNAKIPIFS
jgi:5-methylcytosine-specific restriction endonuclease McrBC regulatory subunit McrC